MIILFVSVIALVSGADWITKNFYQDHLSNEVETRISSHAHLLEKNADDQIIEYIEEVEQGKNSILLILDKELNLSYVSERISSSQLHDFQSWIHRILDQSEAISEPFLDHVETEMRFHIPHVWALMPVYTDEEITGYVFLDQDTGELNHARIKLLYLLLIMGAATVFVGYLFTNYLTRRISKPLNHISEMTQNIAAGDLDIELNVQGKDEVGRLADSIQSMTKQLKEYRDSRRHFISHISHDLRTPITYIKGYSAVMKETPPDEQGEWKRNLTVIYEEATRMEHLVSDLFLLTKLEEGKIKLDKEPILVSDWLTSLYNSRALMFDQKSIHHQLAIPDAVKGLAVWMDSYRMEQAMINLIENAIRHTEKNGAIELSITMQKEKVIFSVADTGSGIAEKDIPHIWERFYKADSSRNRQQGGTGLGLAIVKEIVEAHGGSVSVKSKPGEGTTFILQLPHSP